MEYYNKNGIRVRNTKKEDIEYLKDKLRVEDTREIWNSHHHLPEDALRLSLEKSLFALTIENGCPIAVFGVTVENVLDSKGVIWMLGSRDLEKIKIRFLKNCKKFIRMFLDAYPYLENYVDCDNKHTIEWLKFCGAVIEPPIVYGVEGKKFCHFYFKRGR